MDVEITLGEFSNLPKVQQLLIRVELGILRLTITFQLVLGLLPLNHLNIAEQSIQT